MTPFRFLTMLLVLILLNIYIFMRGWQALPAKASVHFLYSVLYVFASSAIFIAIFAGNALPVRLSHIFELAGGYWIILFIYIFAAVFLVDLLRIANHYLGIFPQWITSNYQQVKIICFISVIAILTLISVIGYVRFANPVLTKIEVPVGNPHPGENDVHIVAASDLHLGNMIRRDRLAGWVDLINEQKPDIILLVGDIFDKNMEAVEIQKMDVEFARLNATYGVYAVPGNHDYYAGIDRALSYIEKSGIKVLRDTAVIINDRLVLIGRDDRTNHNRKPLQSLINGFDSDLPRIVLDHQPLSLAESAENDIDLHLSGHTHNGQIFPLNRIVSKIYELGYGYRKSGKTHYYVTSGLGLWGAPIRLGTKSEIVSITLKIN